MISTHELKSDYVASVESMWEFLARVASTAGMRFFGCLGGAIIYIHVVTSAARQLS